MIMCIYIWLYVYIYIFKIWQVNVVILCKYFEWFQVLVDALWLAGACKSSVSDLSDLIIVALSQVGPKFYWASFSPLIGRDYTPMNVGATE